MMALSTYLTLLWILYVCNNFVLGYPTGAPQTACTTMAPIHSGVAPQSSRPPFQITVLDKSYRPNQNISVILSAPCSTEQFAGFLLEARRADVTLDRDEPLGTFNTGSESKHVALCGNGQQAVTHVDTAPKSQLVFQWTAPQQLVGHIVFAVTFASSKSRYWVKVYSSIIREEGNVVGPNIGSESYPTLSTCSIVPTQPSLPTLSPEPMCGTSKTCFSDCTDQNCGYIVSWTNSSSNPNGIEFELSTIVDRPTNRWMAIGFSNDTQMGEDKVVECVSFNNVINVYPSYNRIIPRKENIRNENPLPSDGIFKINTSIVDGIFRCSFLVVSDQFTYINLSLPWYLMFASGQTATFKATKIQHTVDPPVTSEKIVFIGDNLNLPPIGGDNIIPNGGSTSSPEATKIERTVDPPVTSEKIVFTEDNLNLPPIGGNNTKPNGGSTSSPEATKIERTVDPPVTSEKIVFTEDNLNLPPIGGNNTKPNGGSTSSPEATKIERTVDPPVTSEKIVFTEDNLNLPPIGGNNTKPNGGSTSSPEATKIERTVDPPVTSEKIVFTEDNLNLPPIGGNNTKPNGRSTSSPGFSAWTYLLGSIGSLHILSTIR